MTIALQTVHLEKQFGGLKVTRDLSLQVGGDLQGGDDGIALLGQQGTNK